MAVTFKNEPVEAQLPPAKPKSVDPAEYKKALDAISKHRKAIAWQVGRYPLEKRIIPERTKIHLPRSYLARHGEDVKPVWPGTDLNQLVHTHYFELVDEALVSDSPNYVTPDKIEARKHEYLGPDPRIAGYRFDGRGEIHIKWWDGFLADLWMDGGKWSFDVKMTDDGKWVEVDD